MNNKNNMRTPWICANCKKNPNQLLTCFQHYNNMQNIKLRIKICHGSGHLSTWLRKLPPSLEEKFTKPHKTRTQNTLMHVHCEQTFGKMNTATLMRQHYIKVNLRNNEWRNTKQNINERYHQQKSLLLYHTRFPQLNDRSCVARKAVGRFSNFNSSLGKSF